MTRRKDRWPLKSYGSHKVIKAFETRAKATTGGALRRAVGKEGGSVKIRKENGRFQKERTYPHGKDPRRSRS
jgi:hypothetical protein